MSNDIINILDVKDADSGQPIADSGRGLSSNPKSGSHQGETGRKRPSSSSSSSGGLQKDRSVQSDQIQHNEAKGWANTDTKGDKSLQRRSNSKGKDAEQKEDHSQIEAGKSASQDIDPVCNSQPITVELTSIGGMVPTLSPVLGPSSSLNQQTQSHSIAKLAAEATNTTPTKPNKSQKRDPYQRRVLIADCLYGFPTSGSLIPAVYHEHSQFISDCLLREIEAHRSPVSKAKAPDIDMYLVGTGPADVKPAIVVTCGNKLLKHTETILCTETVQNQHNLVLYKKSALSSSRKWQYPKNYKGDGPCYYLYVRTSHVNRLQFGGIMLPCFASLEPDASTEPWCGSKVVQEESLARATLSCILGIGPRIYGLTTAHGFEIDAESIRTVQQEGVFSLSRRSNGSMLIPDLNALQTKTQNLDWALMKIPPYRISTVESDRIIPLGVTAAGHPEKERDILILSSRLDVPCVGTLLCGVTLSGAGDDLRDVTYWLVELEDDNALQQGDSGSLVIDALTREVYGYVVARDTLSHPWKLSEEAEELQKRVEQEDESTLINQPEDRTKASAFEYKTPLSDINEQGNLCYHKDKLEQAETLYKQALKGKETALGTEHVSTLQTVNNIGCLYSKQGKLSQAEDYLTRALKGSEEAVGSEHKTTLNIINNLANLYRTQGKLAAAENLLLRALEGKKKVFGLDHPSTLDTMNNLGLVFFDQCKFIAADNMYKATLESKERRLGQMNTSTLITVNNLANLYRQQGNLPEATAMYSRALQGMEKTLGLGHSLTQTVIKNSSIIHQAQMSAVAERYETKIM